MVGKPLIGVLQKQLVRMLAGGKVYWRHLFLIPMAEENSLCHLQCYWGWVDNSTLKLKLWGLFSKAHTLIKSSVNKAY